MGLKLSFSPSGGAMAHAKGEKGSSDTSCGGAGEMDICGRGTAIAMTKERTSLLEYKGRRPAPVIF